MTIRNCFLIYLFLTGDFVQSNEDYILSKQINESYNLGYVTMLFTQKDGGSNRTEFNDRTSTATYFTTSKQNVNDFPMTYYNSSGFTENPSTKSPLYFSNNSVIYQDEISNSFMYIKLSISLMVLIIGLVANSLSFLIIVKQGLIKSGVWVYIASLAVTDNLALIMSFFYGFSGPPFNILGDIPNSNNIFCKTLSSFGYLWALMSNYIVSFMTIQRCMLIVNPYRVPPGQRQAIISVLIIAAIIMIIQPSYVFTFIGIVELDIPNTSHNNSITTIKFCSMLTKYQKISMYYFMLDGFIYTVVPIILIISANSCIVFTLIKRHKNGELQKVHKNAKKDMNVTYMLLSISLLFVITLTPVIIFYVTWEYFYNSFEEAIAFESIGLTITGMLAMTNHSCNFFCYVLSGEIFRERAAIFFRSIFCCWDDPQPVGQQRGRANVRNMNPGV